LIKRKAVKRKASSKRKAVKRKASSKRKAAKRKASSKRRASSRMDLVLKPPRLRRPAIQSPDIYATRKPRLEKIPEGTVFKIHFKIDSGNMKRDSSVLGQIINHVDLICVPLKIKYEFNVSSGCIAGALGLTFLVSVIAGIVVYGIIKIIKYITSKGDTKITYVDDELKLQLVKAKLIDNGYAGYTIDDTEELNTGTVFYITLATGKTKKIIINEHGEADWI